MLVALVAIMMPIGAWAQESTVEAKWGTSTSAESLTSGTLAEAIEATVVNYDNGNYTASDVAYIQLQSDVTTTSDHIIRGGTFTLDLNGHTLTSDGYTLDIRDEGTSVTLVDYSEGAGGKVVSTGTGAASINLTDGASLTIKSGSYEAASTAVLISSGSSAIITGGTFTGGDEYSAIRSADGTLSISGGSFGGTNISSSVGVGGTSVSTTITGGTFAEGTQGTIEYYGGKLDLTGYPPTATEGTTPLTDISVYSAGYGAIAVGAETLALPAGYCFYNGKQAVTVLAVNAKYTIGAEPDTQYTVTYAANGGSGTMDGALSYGGDYILPECTFTAPEGKMFEAWQVGDTEYQPGAIITVDANTTVTAVWRDYVPQIILELTDSYGDGWNGAAITVKKDGEEIGTDTITAGNTATFRYDYDNTCEYTFYWTKGIYDYECSFVIKVEDDEVLTATTEDCDGYEDGQLIHTIEAEAIVVEALTIADGGLTEYSNDKMAYVGTLTYTRTLPNTEWNALYVPFEVEVTEALLVQYDVAYANNMHAYDTDDNGEIDELEMEVIKIKQGTLHANHPYFIRAKSEAARALTLTMEDATLYATESTTLTCQSIYTTYSFTGIYSAMDAADFAALDGAHYAIATEGGWWRTEGLNPFRVYMTITEREGSPVKVSEAAMARVRIVTRGEETTEIEKLESTVNGGQSTVIYDLQGRRVAHPAKGIYIVNGRKVIK